MAVIDHFRAGGVKALVYAVTATGGPQATGSGWDWNVPKGVLVSTFRTVLLPGRFRVARVPFADRLKAEVEGFTEHITRARNVVYEAEDEQGGHGDVLFAALLAVWLGERHPPWGAGDIRQGGPRLAAQAPPGTYLTGGTRPPPRW
jgi:hypothetical protein